MLTICLLFGLLWRNLAFPSFDFRMSKFNLMLFNSISPLLIYTFLMTYVLLLVIINARKSSIYLADFGYLTVIQINSFSLNCQNLTCTLGLDDPTQTHSSLLLIQLHRIFLKSKKNQWPRSKLAYFKNPTALSQDTSATCSPLNFAIGTRCQALKKGFPAKGLFTHITQGPTNTPPWSLLSRIDA